MEINNPRFSPQDQPSDDLIASEEAELLLQIKLELNEKNIN
jgi:hypothetical protein